MEDSIIQFIEIIEVTKMSMLISPRCTRWRMFRSLHTYGILQVKYQSHPNKVFELAAVRRQEALNGCARAGHHAEQNSKNPVLSDGGLSKKMIHWS